MDSYVLSHLYIKFKFIIVLDNCKLDFIIFYLTVLSYHVMTLLYSILLYFGNITVTLIPLIKTCVYNIFVKLIFKKTHLYKLEGYNICRYFSIFFKNE